MKEETIIKKDWCNYFGLTPISQSKYYKIVGCFVVGFELIRIPNRGLIHPHFVIYPLWRENFKLCMKTPYHLYGFRDKKNLQAQMSPNELIKKEEEVFDIANNYIGYNIKVDIPSIVIYNLMNKYQPNEVNDPWRLMVVAESNIYQSVYMNDRDMFTQAISAMDDVFIRINPHLRLVESIYGKYEKRKELFVSLFEKQASIVELIEKNANDSKIKQKIKMV